MGMCGWFQNIMYFCPVRNRTNREKNINPVCISAYNFTYIPCLVLEYAISCELMMIYGNESYKSRDVVFV